MNIQQTLTSFSYFYSLKKTFNHNLKKTLKTLKDRRGFLLFQWLKDMYSWKGNDCAAQWQSQCDSQRWKSNCLWQWCRNLNGFLKCSHLCEMLPEKTYTLTILSKSQSKKSFVGLFWEDNYKTGLHFLFFPSISSSNVKSVVETTEHGQGSSHEQSNSQCA